MAVQRTLVWFAATALLMQLAMAVNYTVGAPNGGWDSSTDLGSWAASQSFAVGDNLIFQYAAGTHSVAEVNKAAYDACSTSNSIQFHTDGNTVITLSSPGKRYFICAAPGHCANGMKVEIDTLATSSPTMPPSAFSPTMPPSASSPTLPPSASSPQSGSPVSSPEVSSPSPAGSPEATLPSPEGSLPFPNVPSTESPATAPSPGSSSATKGVSTTTVTMGFILGMLMLLFH